MGGGRPARAQQPRGARHLLTSQAVGAPVGPGANALVAKPQVDAAPPVLTRVVRTPVPSRTACPDVERGARADVAGGHAGGVDPNVLQAAHEGRRGRPVAVPEARRVRGEAAQEGVAQGAWRRVPSERRRRRGHARPRARAVQQAEGHGLCERHLRRVPLAVAAVARERQVRPGRRTDLDVQVQVAAQQLQSHKCVLVPPEEQQGRRLNGLEPEGEVTTRAAGRRRATRDPQEAVTFERQGGDNFAQGPSVAGGTEAAESMVAVLEMRDAESII